MPSSETTIPRSSTCRKPGCLDYGEFTCSASTGVDLTKVGFFSFLSIHSTRSTGMSPKIGTCLSSPRGREQIPNTLGVYGGTAIFMRGRCTTQQLSSISSYGVRGVSNCHHILTISMIWKEGSSSWSSWRSCEGGCGLSCESKQNG